MGPQMSQLSYYPSLFEQLGFRSCTTDEFKRLETYIIEKVLPFLPDQFVVTWIKQDVGNTPLRFCSLSMWLHTVNLLFCHISVVLSRIQIQTETVPCLRITPPRVLLFCETKMDLRSSHVPKVPNHNTVFVCLMLTLSIFQMEDISNDISPSVQPLIAEISSDLWSLCGRPPWGCTTTCFGIRLPAPHLTHFPRTSQLQQGHVLGCFRPRHHVWP